MAPVDDFLRPLHTRRRLKSSSKYFAQWGVQPFANKINMIHKFVTNLPLVFYHEYTMDIKK